MARGDQIYAMREFMGIPYEHHGIDCGDGSVIHYRKVGEPTITRTRWEAFSRGSAVYTQAQPVAFIADVVIARAESRLGEQRYDLFFNNCEHFALWCKTGQNESEQLNNFGLRLEQVKLPQASTLAGQAAREESPVAALTLFQNALDNLAIATNSLLPDYRQAQKDLDTWQRVAQKALAKGREDLARAALHRKVDVRKKAEQLKQQLSEISELQVAIQRDQDIARQRLMVE
jgi:hypothetical protein